MHKGLILAIGLLGGSLFASDSTPNNAYLKPIYSNYSIYEGKKIYSTTRTGLQFEYDFIQPGHLYYGSHLLLTYSKNQPLDSVIKHYTNDEYLGQVNLGYTIGYKHLLLIPYSLHGIQANVENIWSKKVEEFPDEVNGGTGVHITNSYEKKITMNWVSGLGIKGEIPLSKMLSVGLDTNAFLYPKRFFSKHRWGYKFSLPITYGANSWSYSLAPFYKNVRYTIHTTDKKETRASMRDWGTALAVRISF